MQPTLMARAGPIQGQIIHLAEGETSLGRDSTNLVVLEDASASLQHCRIMVSRNVVTIVDLGTDSGTTVNGIRVKEARLHHGDKLQVGSSVFVLRLTDKEENDDAVVEKDDIDLSEYDSVVLSGGDSVYLRRDEAAAPSDPAKRVVQDLGALVRISTSINTVRGSDALQKHLLELVFEVIPADRGAILLVGHNPEIFVSEMCKIRGLPDETVFKASRTITRRVLREGVAILSNKVPDEAALSSNSLRISMVRSLLCVPLKVFDNTLGVIYLDTITSLTGFDEGHQQLLSAIGAIGAIALDHARYDEWIEREKERLEDTVDLEHKLLGRSPRVEEVNRSIARYAPQDTNVLICGESGTGKDVVANLIHRNSKRAHGPFVAINCGAISPDLLSNELFGHEKEGFTGASTRTKGKIEAANGGTLFLDEIGEMPVALQAGLLRVLDRGGEFQRVGGTQTIRADIRLICATNKNLDEARRAGKFREDLYYRIKVATINMSPLRERRSDIPLLADHFLNKYGKKYSKDIQRVSPDALRILESYDWPGNIRELENKIEVGVINCSTSTIQPGDLPEDLLQRDLPGDVQRVPFHEAVLEFKRQLILKTVQQAKFVYVDAASSLGIHPNNLHRLIRQMNLRSRLEELERADSPGKNDIR